MDKLTIVMSTDKNYIMPTKVAIYTMLKHSSPDVFLQIHILCGKELDYDSRNYLKELEERYSEIELIFDEIDGAEIGNAKTYSYITVATYYRLFISRLLQADKCLYIDGDVIIQCNLKELYDMDLEDYYIAAVRDCAVQNGKNDFKRHHLALGLPSLDDYVNAGIMLFNLKKIRECHLDEKFFSVIEKGYRYMDQDILNKCCYGNIKHIPLKYNLFSEYYQRVGVMPKNLYTEEELREAQEKPAVIHYPGVLKPWICTRLKVNKLWWKYAEELLEQSELQEWKEKAKSFEEKSDITYIFGKIEKYENVVIWGFSDNCRQLLDKLLIKFAGKKFLFCDNDINKQTMEYKNVMVYSFRQIVQRQEGVCWIIGSQNAYMAIRNQLLDEGIAEENIVRYIHKDTDYYERLAPEFLEYEKRILNG